MMKQQHDQSRQSATGTTAVSAQTTQASLWMIGAIISFSLMAIAGRELGQELTTFEIMAYRSTLGLPIVALLVVQAGGFGLIKTHQPSGHLLRNVVHFAAQNCWFYAVATIALAQVIALEFTNPIWMLLLAPLMLGETLTKRKIVSAFIGFLGVLIVARPGYSPLEWGHLAGLCAAIGFAITNITTKKLARDDSLLCIVFWMTLSQAVMGYVVAVPQGLTMPSVAAWPFVILTGITGLTAHYSLTMALKMAPALVVAPMDFMRLPVLAVAGALLYGEPLEVAVFIGAGLILAGNLVNMIWRER